MSAERLASIPLESPFHAAYKEARATFIAVLNARSAGPGRGSDDAEREGLSAEQVDVLMAAIDPASPTNPWTEGYPRERNRLLILWGLLLGLRRGELLGIRIEDIDFRKQTVRVRRRADDPGDPRKHQPNTKTRGREVPLSSELATLTLQFVMAERRKFADARRHGFLFAADRTGAPLALTSVSKIYRALREKVPGLPENFTLHVLRHTWNDRFSERMDAQKVPEAEEEKLRSYLMGWVQGSRIAATYTRRHTREKAKQASLELQGRMLKDTGDVQN